MNSYAFQKLLTSVFLILILFICAIGTYHVFFERNGLVRQWELEEFNSKTEKRIVEMNKDIVALQDTIQWLKSDSAFIERMARSQLGMMRSGEKIFYFENEDTLSSLEK